MTLLSVKDLRTYFETRHGQYKAVDGVSYDLQKGETLAIVGESGSGKSVTHHSLMGLIPMPPGRIVSGTALFDGIDLLNCSKKEQLSIRGKRISMIFQDPMTCLNPYLKIGTQVMEPLFIHQKISKSEAKKLAIQALSDVGIVEAEHRLNDYPHQFSGGMRQRVMIAMALITHPEILIADEPTTALDVTVQAQILNLIKAKQKENGMAVIYITHNLSVVAGIADRINVMYAGRIVESGSTNDIFYHSKHPYTKALLDSLPLRHNPGERLFTIPGLPPDVSQKINGCHFAARCSFAKETCTKNTMNLKELATNHSSSCHLEQEGLL